MLLFYYCKAVVIIAGWWVMGASACACILPGAASQLLAYFGEKSHGLSRCPLEHRWCLDLRSTWTPVLSWWQTGDIGNLRSWPDI